MSCVRKALGAQEASLGHVWIVAKNVSMAIEETVVLDRSAAQVALLAQVQSFVRDVSMVIEVSVGQDASMARGVWAQRDVSRVLEASLAQHTAKVANPSLRGDRPVVGPRKHYRQLAMHCGRPPKCHFHRMQSFQSLHRQSGSASPVLVFVC